MPTIAFSGSAAEPLLEPPPGPGLPGQRQMLALSLVFVFSSVTLFIEFLLIYHAGAGSPGAHLWWDGCPDQCPRSASLWINGLGAASCLGWAAGFVLLLDWNVNSLPPPHGRWNLSGVCLKIVAAVLFNIQPWSYLMDPNAGIAGLGVVWSNFAGIAFFHLGNCINAVDMTMTMMDWNAIFSKPNWPVLGMWVFMVATWFLAVADGMAYFNLRCNVNTLVLNGTTPFAALGVSSADSWQCQGIVPGFITPGQLTGSFLLTVGSVLYTAWAW